MSVEFELTYHTELTQQANHGVLGDEQLAYVIWANLAQDLNQVSSMVHFDNCDFPGGVGHIGAEWNLIESAGDKYSEAALGAFGALLHTTQDFYAHSNWIELHLDRSPVPVWDQQLASLPPAIVSGTWWIGFPKMCGPGAPSHSQLNKDSPDSEEGSKVVGSGPNAGKNYFQLAFATALAASRLQFDRLAALNFPLAAAESATRGSVLERLIRGSRRLREPA